MHLPILASKLQERGHAVLAVCHPDGQIGRDTSSRGIPTEAIRLGKYADPVATMQLIRILRREQPHILHLHLSRDLWQAVPASAWTGSGRIILTKHIGSYIRKHDPLHRWLYNRVDRVLTVSDILRRNVIETCPIAPERVTTVHHALDLKRYDRTQYEATAVRRELGIEAPDVVIGTVGRISPGKGYEEFLHAARRIREDGAVPAKFLIVGAASYGEEPYYETVVDLTRRLGLAEDVLFAGFRRDIPQLLCAMDVFVFPSRAEGLGATLLEAMAMGVPCVSTNSDGTQDIIQNRVTGLTVTPGDEQAMATAVLTFIRDADLRNRVIAMARRQIEEKFDLDVMTSKIEDIYRESMSCRTATGAGI